MQNFRTDEYNYVTFAKMALPDHAFIINNNKNYFFSVYDFTYFNSLNISNSSLLAASEKNNKFRSVK